MFPTPNDDQPEVITIIGKQESVEAARKDLEEQIKELVCSEAIRTWPLLLNSCFFSLTYPVMMLPAGEHRRRYRQCPSQMA